jgi:hypothetical protein
LISYPEKDYELRRHRLRHLQFPVFQNGREVIMTTEVGSTVPRRQLGRHLRLLRERAHVTVKDAA